MSLADLDGVIARSMSAWRPPPRLSLSEWADEFFRLSPETAAEPGRWTTLPYQRGVMDAITDSAVSHVTMMKSSRIGYTLMFSAAIGYFMHHEPASMLVVQPTVDDAKNFSKETIASMLRDVPVLASLGVTDLADEDGRTRRKGPKDSSNTIQHKSFPGGVLSLVGANSGTGFRRIGRRVLFLDEVDAYPPSAGSEGDPVSLAIKRTQAYWNRKIVDGSSPLVAGASRIEELYEQGDKRRYFVPCPQCGHMAPLVFRGEDGHSMKWPDGKPEEAFFACQAAGCVIEHKDKRWMIERGGWRAEKPFRGHASFRIWSAYSYLPNFGWGDIASEFAVANAGGPEKLKTFVNTVLGETWVEKGDAPEWQRLYQRRESYAAPPRSVIAITAGVDVQKDRLVYEVVGWGEDLQSWSLEADIIAGDTAKEETWAGLDALLNRTWTREDGSALPIHVLAVDAGFNTQTVYNWTRRYPMSRVIAVKGVAASRALLGAPSAVDVTRNGKRAARGAKVWLVGANIAKSELYGWLRIEPPTKESGAPFPAGFCHFSDADHAGNGEDFFKQLTGEHLVKIVKRGGFIEHEWQVRPGHENHWLDARVYARAATARLQLDRIAAAKRVQAQAPAPAPVAAPPVPAATPAPTEPRQHLPARSGWLTTPRGGMVGGGGWIRRR